MFFLILQNICASSPLLDWNQRSPQLCELIDNTARKVFCRARDWGQFPGNPDAGDDYGIMGLPDSWIIAELIRGYPSKKDWCFMDLGAGNCAWGRKLASFLNREFAPELASGEIKFRIISLTGDTNTQPLPSGGTALETCCAVEEKYCFPIENLAAQLPHLVGKIDAVVSFATFMHLADPVGTYAQTLHMLAENGLLMTDNYIHGLVDSAQVKLPDLLGILGLPCVICPFEQTFEGVLTAKTPSKTTSGPALLYSSLALTPADNRHTHATITSPCQVFFERTTPKQVPVFSKFEFNSKGWPEIPMRRAKSKAIHYICANGGEEELLKLVESAGQKMPTRQCKSFTTIGQIKEHMYGRMGLKRLDEAEQIRLNNLDLQGWQNHYLKSNPAPFIRKHSNG